MEFEIKLLVHEKLSKVWEVFMDESKLKKWVSGLKKRVQTSGKTNTIGSRYEMTFDVDGKEMVITEEVQEVIKNKRYASVFEGGGIKTYEEINFHARGYSTEIVSYSNVEGKTFKAKLMVGLKKGKMRKRQEKDLNSLKTLIEGKNKASKSLKR